MDEKILNIIEKYKDISLINDYLESEYGKESIYKVGLATGYPGISIMLYEAYKITGNHDYYNRANVYLSETIKIISSSPMYSTSLFSGSFGVIFALTHCSDNGRNYFNIIHSLLSQYDYIYEQQYNEVSNSINQKIFDDFLYDTISGYSGILNTLLYVKDKYGDKIHEKLHNHIINCITILEKIVVLAIHNDNFKEKNILNNLGMAHGITGVINSLVSAYNRGFDKQSNDFTLKEVRNFYLNNIKEVNYIKRIPNFVNEELNHRDAWCYGTPGVAFCLKKISELMKDKDLNKISMELLNTTLQRNVDERGLISPTLCHGYSGIIAIAKNLDAKNIVDYYHQKILDCFSSSEFGFYDLNMEDNAVVK
ncbi:lanthionine synthetase C family protein, partial [Salmonella enterica]|uniref:lanthionine synthetase C family protein n=1 Tax=Salmonella enterica TaxID=28901 RepID=UPI0031B580B1